MYRFKQKIRKVITFLALLSVLGQSFTPFLYTVPKAAYAQEAAVTSAPTESLQTETITSTPDQTATVTPTPDSSSTPAPTDTAVPTPTDNLQETVTPVQADEPTIAPTEQVNNNSPPSNENNNSDNSSTPTSTVEASPTAVPAADVSKEENVSLSIVVLENTSAPSIDLGSYESQGSASLTTDKKDYAPTDTALVTGSNLTPNTAYMLRIWSDDAPATSKEISVTSDENGAFTYAYQLDGTYRPNYSVELKDSAGNLVASTTFTDSPISGCTEDSGGANDETGQKDLTKMCVDYAGSPTSIGIKWNWDNVSWSGANTGDACSLYDTDSDGNVNYAVCVGVNGNPAIEAYTKLYSCTDNDFNNCTGSSLISSAPASSCTTSLQNTDPFSDGTGYPVDTESSCNIVMSEVGGATATLLDVCSYPSGSPSSVASDCIVFKANSGKIEVIKTLSPTDDPGLFNLQVNGTTYAANVGNGGDTGVQVVDEGENTVGETFGTGTSLSNYTASIVCKDLHGTGNIVSTTGTNPWTIDINDGDDILCNITNTRINNASITIVKDAQPNDAQNFSFTTTGTGLSSFSLDDDSDGTLSNTKTFSNLASGTYSVAEGATSGWTQASATCSDGSPVSAISLQAGESVTCTFTNTRDTGTVELKKVWSGTAGQTTLKIGTSVGGTQVVSTQTGIDGSAPLTTGAQTVNTGTYYVSETGGLTDYSSSLACTKNGQSYTPGTDNSLSVSKDDVIICTFTNTRNTGSVKVNKKVDSGNGFVDANPGSFTWSLDTVGTNAMGSTVSGVNTGSHNISENTVTDYHFVGWYPTASTQYPCANPQGTTLPVSVSVSANTTTDITLCNAINTGTVIVHKDVQGPNGEDVTDASNNFKVSLDAGTGQDISDDLTVTYNNVPVGSHTIRESLIDTDYTLYGISQTQGQSGNLGGLTITVATGTNDVYVTNRQKSGTITVVKDVVNPDGGAVSDTHSFTVNLTPGGQSDSFAEGDNAVFTVNPGTYTASESADIDYTSLGCLTATGKTDIVVGSGESKTVTCTNQQKKATINVIKDVLSPTNGAISDNHAFTAQLNGGNNQSFSESATAEYIVNPGSYSITELTDNNYDYVSCTPDSNQTAGDGAQVTLGSNGSATITCTNKQKNAQVTVVKDVRDPNGSDVSDSTNFVVQRGGADDKDFHEGLNAVYSLAPGTYTFTEIVTGGYTLNSISNDNDADVSNGTTVTLHSGEDQTITFTNYQNSGSISGQKLSDTDGVLGTTDDQSNLINWVIELYTCTSNFTGCVLSTSDTTDSSGYSFLNLVPGYYQVKEVLQSGWTALTSLFQNVTVSSGENETGKNFVNFENVSVTACKVIDADGDITTTDDQTNKFGWTVNLLTDGQTSDTKTTGENGCYTWTDLGPGHTYEVSEATPSGWTTLTDTTHSFGSATGGSEYTYTFVNFENVSISGHKWNDLDGNGVWDEGEPALENWTINLNGDEDTTTTNSDGYYEFTNLGPGTYTISEENQTGWEQTYPTDPASHSVIVASGQNVTDKDFGNQGRGSITVHKMVDSNGDGTYVSGDDGDFTWTLDETGTNIMGDTVSDIPAGTHLVGENDVTDYHFEGWYATGTDYSCTNLPEAAQYHSLPIHVNVGANGTSNFTICNARDTGTITVNKEVVSATEDSGRFDLQVDETTEKTDAQDGDSTGEVTVLTGSHSVSEVAGTETSLSNYISSISCVDGGGEGDEASTDGNGTGLSDIQVSKDDDIVCTITNTKKGKIIVTKYNDKDGDGKLQEGEGVLSGWTINVGEEDPKQTDANGDAEFTNLTPGEYIIGENLKTGWEQTNITCPESETSRQENGDTLGVFVGAGETVSCSILNKSITPILTIAKSNNAVGDLGPGGEVVYTLTLSATQSAAANVRVKDLLPDGFKYVAGSWTATLNGLPLVITEPSYNSPGVWNVGDMDADDVVILTYKAKISDNLQNGLYKDVAWAQGTSLASENVLALAEPTGFVDTNFVGTQVNVVKEDSQSPSLPKNQPQVLGASTSLPATGANNIWVMLVIGMLTLGLSLTVAGYIIRKRYV